MTILPSVALNVHYSTNGWRKVSDNKRIGDRVRIENIYCVKWRDAIPFVFFSIILGPSTFRELTLRESTLRESTLVEPTFREQEI